MDGAQAWESLKARAMALEIVEGRLPAWHFDALRSELKVHLDALKAREDALSEVWSEDSREIYQGLLASTETLSVAGPWVQAQRDRQTTDRPIREISERALKLRRAGMRSLEALESLGIVPSAEAAAIRRGQGYSDVAGDLQALAPILKRHWPLLEPLQEHIPTDDARLNRDMLDQMPATAIELIDADRNTQPSVDWYGALRRLSMLIEADWDRLRAMTTGALAALDETHNALPPLPSLLALVR